MKRLVIIVEGDSEKEFVNQTLSPFLFEKGISVITCFKITKTGGGLTNYEHLKRDIVKSIHEENVLVTTMIDFYALPQNFPKYKEAKNIADKGDKISFLENAILEDIQGNGYFPDLIPYIQLHEFEALTFTDVNGFQKYFSKKRLTSKGYKI